jgi:adenylate cyclase
VKRRMAAIMVGDIVGYSTMMEKSEEKTVARLATCQALISKKVASLDGRIFNMAGDATLAEFPSPINALRCAVEIGVALAGADGSEVEPLKMRFGLHLADVAVRGDDLVGDGVNLAARIQQAAAPGSVWVSGVLFDHIRRNSPFVFDDLGERRFKNLSEPVRVYRVRGEIGAHRLQSAPTRPSGDTRKRPSSVAIMPFRVSGGDEDQRFLAEGLTEELIVELGRFRRLSVASRSATFALAESNPDPVSVGDLLSVRYVLDGQVRKIGKTMRIGLTLSETEAGSVVWSEKITRPFEDLLDVLDETVSKIAATVAGRMEDASIVTARRRPPDNIEAFECLLRGIDHHRLGGVTDENAREAIKWFSKAIEADPNYAAAYAWRVCAASWLPEFDIGAGERDIRRALELDSCDPEVNRILGFIELLKGNFDQAKSLSLRALEMNPTDAYMRARSAAVLTYAGEPLRSLSLLDEAEALDPLLPVWCIEERGVTLYALERYQEALEAFGRLVFQTCRSRLYGAATQIALDRPDEARKLAAEAIAGNPSLTATSFMTKECYRDLEKRNALQERLEKAGLPK